MPVLSPFTQIRYTCIDRIPYFLAVFGVGGRRGSKRGDVFRGSYRLREREEYWSKYIVNFPSSYE